jgi:hypothetical protein
MRVVICVPRWPDNGRRDQIWKWLRAWLEERHNYPIFEGHAEGPGEARNLAAQAAGNWDVALFCDADTVTHPEAIHTAITNAAHSGRMTNANDSYMYLSETSSDRILSGEKYWFCRPYSLDLATNHNIVFRTPCSGVYALPRGLYDRIGGIPGAGPWGVEDQILFELCRIFGGSAQWTPEHIALHLWHEPAPRTWASNRNHPEKKRNYLLWRQLARLRGIDAQNQARLLMHKTLGHNIP